MRIICKLKQKPYDDVVQTLIPLGNMFRGSYFLKVDPRKTANIIMLFRTACMLVRAEV